jgi:hypothetical protein
MIFGLIGAALLVVGDAYRLRRFCWAAPVLVLFLLASQPCLSLVPTTTYDHLLLTADYRLGHDFAVGRAFSGPTLINAIHMVYAMLPLTVAYVYSLLDGDPRKRFGFAALLAGAAAPFFYAICPAAGPAYVFGDAFPFHPPVLEFPLPFSAPGLTMNAVPSGHLAWAMLAWWHSRPCIVGVRIATGLFVLGTAVATLASGEHYLVDLVVAVPFAVAVDAVIGRRWVSAASCAAVVLAWSLALRAGMVSAASSRVAIPLAAATVVAPLVLRAFTPDRSDTQTRSRRASRTAT